MHYNLRWEKYKHIVVFCQIRKVSSSSFSQHKAKIHVVIKMSSVCCICYFFYLVFTKSIIEAKLCGKHLSKQHCPNKLSSTDVLNLPFVQMNNFPQITARSYLALDVYKGPVIVMVWSKILKSFYSVLDYTVLYKIVI